MMAGKIIHCKCIGLQKSKMFLAIGVVRGDGIVMVKNDLNGMEVYENLSELQSELLKYGKDVLLIDLKYLKAHQVPIQIEEQYYITCKVLKGERKYVSRI